MAHDSRARQWFRWGLTRLVLPLLIIALAVGGYVWLDRTGPTPPAAEVAERAWRVDTTVIERATHQPRLTLTGEVRNPDQVVINAPLTARVASLPVADGDAVDPGDLLVALDPADYEPPLRRAEAELADLQAQITEARRAHESDQQALEIEQALVDTAQRSLERTLTLQNDELASPSAVEADRDALNQARLALNARQQRVATFEARLASLQARRKAAQAELRRARRDVRRSRVEAPGAGIITEREVAIGSRVDASQALLTFLPRDGFEVRALIPNQRAEPLLRALARDEHPTAEARLLGGSVTLRLMQLSGSASARGVTGLFRFEAPDTTLRPGEVVRLELRMPAMARTIAVPPSALYGNDRVYRIRDGRLERVAVEHLGTTRVDGAERALIRGPALSSGDRIATTQLPNAVEGLRVERADSDEGSP
jgi:multidrug efflux pump subunit AcrA (membrane-fusion protein)